MARRTISRNSMWGGLLHIKQLGFVPGTVIDVGAALGTFQLYEMFPRSRHLLIEPIHENAPYLAQICRKLPQADYIIAAATRKPGTASLQVAPELVHSSASIDPDPSLEYSNGQMIRKVEAITLDQICSDKQLEPPYLIKVDVDGNEVDVLAGAIEVLKETEYVIVEVSLFNQIYEVINFMQSQGFAIYDMLNLAYRAEDDALWQADMAFVKANGRFRQNKVYVFSEQEGQLADHLKAFRKSCISHIEQCYSDTAYTALPEGLNLRSINLVAFPDWSQPEDLLLQDLADLLQIVIAHPSSDQINLLIDSTGIESEDADIAISSAVMYLLTEENLDVAEQGPEIKILDLLSVMQWQALLPNLTARIALSHNNEQAIALADAQFLKVVSLEGVSKVGILEV